MPRTSLKGWQPNQINFGKDLIPKFNTYTIEGDIWYWNQYQAGPAEVAYATRFLADTCTSEVQRVSYRIRVKIKKPWRPDSLDFRGL